MYLEKDYMFCTNECNEKSEKYLRHFGKLTGGSEHTHMIVYFRGGGIRLQWNN